MSVYSRIPLRWPSVLFPTAKDGKTHAGIRILSAQPSGLAVLSVRGRPFRNIRADLWRAVRMAIRVLCPYFEQVICRYLDYGVLKNGFARVRCEECGHEYLLGHSFKRRHFNPLSSTRLKTALLYPVIIHLCRGRFRLQPFSHKIQCRQLCLQVLASDRQHVDHVKAGSK